MPFSKPLQSYPEILYIAKSLGLIIKYFSNQETKALGKQLTQLKFSITIIGIILWQPSN